MSPVASAPAAALSAPPTTPWRAIAEPGRLTLLSGGRGTMRAAGQELAHDAVHGSPGTVLWCDGDHGFNPYDYAELNLTRGHDAEYGADRVLVKRCMTPFQWDAVLTKHLEAKLHETTASLVLAAPYDALFSTDELRDWEQEDYVAYSLRHLRDLAARHRVPVVLTADMNRWWRTHPTLATMTYDAAGARWVLQRTAGGWRATPASGEEIVAPAHPARQLTLLDFAGLAAAPTAPRPAPLAAPAPRHRQARLRA